MALGTTEYKTIHRPVGNLFPKLASEAERAGCMLSPSQLEFFAKNGFVKGPQVLNEEQIERLRESLERIRQGKNKRLLELYEVDEDYVRAPTQNVFHFLGAWMIDEAFHDILFHPKITVPISQLLGSRKVRMWHDQVFYKPANHPGVVTWHQDYSYWTRSVPARHLTCWIGLDDSTLDNGCVHFIPGSHQWDLVPKVSLTKDMEAVKDYLTPEQREQFQPVPMILKAGECSFHDCFTMHGSYGNVSDRPRREVVLNFMHPETRSADGKQPLLAHTPIIPEGEIVAGDNYPILYDADEPFEK